MYIVFKLGRMYKQKKFFILFLNLFFVSEIFAFQVIVDQSNHQVYSAFDTGFAGLSQFSEIVYKNKGHVWQNYEPLEEVLPKIKSETLLILGVSLIHSYKKETIDAVENYVKKGGHLLVLLEHDNFFNNAKKQNQLIQRFGVKAYYGKAMAKERNWKKNIWPQAQSPLFNLNNIRLFLPAPLKYGKNNTALLKIMNPLNKAYNVVATINESQKGKVIVLGDMEILWNMQKDTGINFGDNKNFFTKMLSYLFPQRQEKKPKFNQGFKKNLFVYTCQNGMDLRDSLGGVTKFIKGINRLGYNVKYGCKAPKDSIVLITTPIKKLPQLDANHKFILVADGQSNDLKNKNFESILKNDLRLKINQKVYDYPLNKILRPYGLEINSSSLTPIKDPSFIMEAEIKGSPLILRRSAVISDISHKNDILGFSKKGYALEYVVPQYNDVNKIFEKKGDLKKYPFLIKNERVFLISDLELINNQFYHLPQAKIIENLIVKWL